MVPGRWINEMRFTLRGLRGARLFAFISIATLALGIGANTAIFSAVRAVLLEPPPFDEPDRLVIITGSDPARGLVEKAVSFPNWEDLRGQSTSFEDIAAWASFTETRFNLVTGSGEPEAVQYAMVSASFFPVLRVGAALGRTFSAQEEEPGASPVVVLGDAIWRRRFASDPSIIGRTIQLDGKPFTVIGVLPAAFRFATVPREAELWVTFGQDPVRGRRYARTVNYLGVVGRLAGVATFADASRDLDAVATRLAAQYPWAMRGENFRAMRLHDTMTRGLRPALLLLTAAVGLVLLIACANVANLFLARAAGRRTELAVHASLGADRRALAVKLLFESLFIAMGGGALGVLLALWLTDLLALAPWGPRSPLLPFRVAPESVRVDGVVLLFTTLLSVLTGLVFGIVPSLRASRVDPATVLRTGPITERSTSASGSMRGALVVTQVAFAFVLLAIAGLAARTLYRLSAVDTGFRTDGVVAMDLRLPAASYTQPARAAAFYDQLVERTAALGGVTSAALTDALPLSGVDPSSDFFIEGRPPAADNQSPQTHGRTITPGYFDALDIEVIAGRPFDAGDRTGSTRVAIINETMARRHFPDENAIGKRLAISIEAFVSFDPATNTVHWDSAGALRTIVGIVRDVRDVEPAEAAQPQMYVPLDQAPSLEMTLVVRGDAGATTLASEVRGIVAGMDPAQPVAGVQTMDRLRDDALARPRSNSIALGLFAALALILSCVGIYGLMAWMVSTRRHEIGVRLALGGQPAVVQREILAHGARLGIAGIAIGLPIALVAGFAMRATLFDVNPVDPFVLAVAALGLCVACITACYIPARRAAGLDPASCLRQQ
jgi:putative ABC transport system permease protein